VWTELSRLSKVTGASYKFATDLTAQLSQLMRAPQLPDAASAEPVHPRRLQLLGSLIRRSSRCLTIKAGHMASGAMWRP
jgi:hypothetical protein